MVTDGQSKFYVCRTHGTHGTYRTATPLASNRATTYLPRVVGRFFGEKYTPETPWLPQPCDTDESFAFFQQWLFLPAPRQIRSLRTRQVPWERIDYWRRSHQWDLRAQAWDRHLAETRLQAVERVEEALATRHALLAKRVQRLAGKELAKHERQSEEHDTIPILTPDMTLKYIRIGTTIEREAVGLPVSEPKGETGIDYSKLTLDEARTLRNLVAKAEGLNVVVEPETEGPKD